MLCIVVKDITTNPISLNNGSLIISKSCCIHNPFTGNFTFKGQRQCTASMQHKACLFVRGNQNLALNNLNRGSGCLLDIDNVIQEKKCHCGSSIAPNIDMDLCAFLHFHFYLYGNIIHV